MSRKKSAENSTAAPQMTAIEKLAEKHQVEAWALAGLMRANNWGSGKLITESEFLQALRKWLAGPMQRRVK